MAPGYHFEVEDLGDGKFSGQYLAEEVSHSGHQPDTLGPSDTLGGLYRNDFRCLAKGVPFRPPRETPRPHIPGLQTATVTGPAGEEIHTDKHGRIKVQFHWDREGKRDDKSSCWVRVGQAWGGISWGALYLPRIGHEVLVRFLEGNPDRPLLTGGVYNGANPTPYGLPAEKTKSTLKSASSLGSDGFNELRLEDKAAEEEIFAHAQKDEDLLTENDKDQQVLGYEDLLVKKDRKRTVEGNQTLDVTLDEASLVEGNQSLRVQGNRSTTIHGSHSEAVELNQSISVAKNVTTTISQTAAETVGAAKALTIGGGYSINVALALTESTGGLKAVEIGAAHIAYVAGSRQEMVDKDSTAKVGGDWQSEVKGQVSQTIGKDVKDTVNRKSHVGIKEAAAWLAKSFELKADKFSLIVNGKRILLIEKSGKVLFSAKSFTIDGSDIKIKGGKVKMEGAGSPPSAQEQALKAAAVEGKPLCKKCA
jgi:type VI secretion system secreted protein VgrG